MLLSDVFKFGKYKGKTLEHVLSSEQGRDYLYWYVDQPCQKAEFADYDKSQKDSVRRKLNQQQGKFNPKDVSSTMYLSGEIETLKERVTKLENKEKSTVIGTTEKTGTSISADDVEWEE